jgi:hypothetical protein
MKHIVMYEGKSTRASLLTGDNQIMGKQQFVNIFSLN